MSSRKYRLPDESATEDPDEYAQAWISLGNDVAKHFPGYIFAGTAADGVVLARRETSLDGKTYKTVDEIRLSGMAIQALLTGKEPPRRLRDF